MANRLATLLRRLLSLGERSRTVRLTDRLDRAIAALRGRPDDPRPTCESCGRRIEPEENYGVDPEGICVCPTCMEE